MMSPPTHEKEGRRTMLEEGRRIQDGIAIKLDLLHADVIDMKTAMREVAVAITRLAVVEERQTQTASAIERTFVLLQSMEARIAVLELQAVSSRQTNKWANLFIVGGFTAAMIYIAKKVGLM